MRLRICAVGVLLAVALSAPLAANSIHDGFYGNVSIGVGGLLQKTSSKRASSVGPELSSTLGYRERNWEFALDLGLMATPVTYKNGFLLDGVEEKLTTAPSNGGILLDLRYNLLAGYNVIKRAMDAPLYIGAGISADGITIVDANMPVDATIALALINIEAQGNIALDKQKYIEYGLGYGIGDASVTFSSDNGTDSGQNSVEKEMGASWGVRAYVGFRYIASKNTNFFVRLFARHYSLGATKEGVRVSIPPTQPGNTDDKAIIRDTPSIVSLPKSTLSFVGISLGVGF